LGEKSENYKPLKKEILTFESQEIDRRNNQDEARKDAGQPQGKEIRTKKVQ
jgi:hypothetical protein